MWYYIRDIFLWYHIKVPDCGTTSCVPHDRLWFLILLPDYICIVHHFFSHCLKRYNFVFFLVFLNMKEFFTSLNNNLHLPAQYQGSTDQLLCAYEIFTLFRKISVMYRFNWIVTYVGRTSQPILLLFTHWKKLINQTQ